MLTKPCKSMHYFSHVMRIYEVTQGIEKLLVKYYCFKHLWSGANQKRVFSVTRHTTYSILSHFI